MNELEAHHPVNDVRKSITDELDGKCIVLGVTYSAAIYRAIDIARYLIKFGADVYPVLTPSASKIIAPELFEWATGHKPVVELTGCVEHISLARKCDCMVVAPSTLNTMSKIAHGIGDNAVTLTAISMRSMGKPVVIVPAMHLNLWRSQQCIEVVKILLEQGYSVLPPIEANNRLVMAEPIYIARKIVSVTLRGEDLKGYKVIVTAGATREFIDSIRFISNPSSGRMGVYIAQEAFFRGAKTLLVHGHVEIGIAPWIESIEAISTEDMLKTLSKYIEEFKPDALIMAAAPSDFKPLKRFQGKISSRVEKLLLELTTTPKILSEIRRVFNGIIIGFAAEYADSIEELERKAKEKLVEYDLDAIVANPISRKDIGFASEYNEVLIILRDESRYWYGRAHKYIVARTIIDLVKKLLEDKGRE